MKNQKDAIKAMTTIFKCPNCSGEQLIGKPKPKAVKGGGVLVIRGKVKCDHCKEESKVTVYPNGRVRVSKLELAV